MRALGTDPIFSNLIVKKFDRKLHVRLRAASVKYGKSIRNITGEAVSLWLKEEKRKEKERREAKVKQPTLRPDERQRLINELNRDAMKKASA
jgi:hypothetical protein